MNRSVAFDRLVPVPASAHDERHPGRVLCAGGGGGGLLGHRVLSWEVGDCGSVLCQLEPCSELASMAVRTRCTCSASSKEGEGSVPSPSP